jgi:hypothetical protein
MRRRADSGIVTGCQIQVDEVLLRLEMRMPLMWDVGDVGNRTRYIALYLWIFRFIRVTRAGSSSLMRMRHCRELWGDLLAL